MPPTCRCVRHEWLKLRLAMFAGLASPVPREAPTRVLPPVVRDTVPPTRERLTLEVRVGSEAALLIAFESGTGDIVLPVAPLLALAHQYQASGKHFAGVVYAHQMLISIGQCLRDLEIVSKASSPEEMADHVEFLPL